MSTQLDALSAVVLWGGILALNLLFLYPRHKLASGAIMIALAIPLFTLDTSEAVNRAATLVYLAIAITMTLGSFMDKEKQKQKFMGFA